MAVELPSDVAAFLNFLGIPWPNINEDKVRGAATHIRTFVDDVGTTIRNATNRIAAMGSQWSGHSYEQLAAAWASKSSPHTTLLTTGGHILATTLDDAADLIAILKKAVIAELLGFVAVGGFTLVTGGPALETLVTAATRRVVKALEDTVENHIFGDIINGAITHFEGTVGKIVSGVEDAAGKALGVSPGATPLSINPEAVLDHADAIAGYAGEITAHHGQVVTNLSELASA